VFAVSWILHNAENVPGRWSKFERREKSDVRTDELHEIEDDDEPDQHENNR
jgi:hypothetical protein